MRTLAILLALATFGCASQNPPSVNPVSAWGQLFSYVDATTPDGTRIEPYSEDDALRLPGGSVAVYVKYRLPTGQRKTIRGVVSPDGVLKLDK